MRSSGFRMVVLAVVYCAGCFGFWEPVRAGDTIRCSGRVISKGDHMDKVTTFCGEPTHVEQRIEERVTRNCSRHWFERYGGEYPGAPEGEFRVYRDGPRSGTWCREEIVISEWFYNFGSSRLTQTLIFEDSRLVDVQTGGYGY